MRVDHRRLWVGVAAAAALVFSKQPQLQAAPAASGTQGDSIDWRTYNANLAGDRFSPIRSLSPQVAPSLRRTCAYDTGKPAPDAETGPLVISGTIYFTDKDTTYAVDGVTCREKWKHVRTAGLNVTLGTNPGVVAASAGAWPAPQTSPGDQLDPRTYAPESKLVLELHALGVQKYICQPSGTWLFTDPVAALYETRKPLGVHFLNLGTRRPVWQLEDGSSVEAAPKVSVPNGTANIPAVLLQGVATTPGRLGDTTWVQRLNTVGGIAPAGTCTPGVTVAVPYTADYFFWKAKRRRK